MNNTKKKFSVGDVINSSFNAGEEFKKLNQTETDKIVKAVYEASFNNRIYLAKKAHEETGLGVWKDKVIKNVIASRLVYEDIKDKKTVGIITDDSKANIIEIAQPIGPIFCITPITNPTSTVIFKILIALKTRNPIIIKPHGGARKCVIETCKICYEAALEAGAPEDCIQWIKRSTQEETIQMMGHKKTALILATGSVSLVKAAYSSGNPAIGVGPGNVPAYIGKSCYVPFAVEQIVKSKTFDNGTICASEQSIVCPKSNEKSVIEEFKKNGAYFLDKDEIKKLEPIAFSFVNKVMNIQVIGQSATTIAEMAGIDVPKNTKLLIAPLTEVGIQAPLSLEILAPILAFYSVKDFKAAINLCKRINQHGGLGHTVSIFSNDAEKIKEFSLTMNAGRIVVNTPSSQGALGGSYNSLQPSLTLGCGTGGKNITTDNISTQHLLNIQRIAKRQLHSSVAHFDSDYFYNESFTAEQFCNIFGEQELDLI